MFSKEDLSLLKEKGISTNDIENQLNLIKNGFPYLEIQSSASTGNGIISLNEDEKNKYLNCWASYLNGDKTVYKFVPASGAASRMFKNMFAFIDSNYEEPQTDFEKKFFNDIENFAFYHKLNEICIKNESKNIPQLIDNKQYKAIVKNMLNPEGMNYGSLPKGLLYFHSYGNTSRKAVIEHLVEGALYTKNKNNDVNIHFTVSPEHINLFKKEIEKEKKDIENRYNAKFHISYSVQKPSTDTIAADTEYNPFRIDGKLFFRPGGHGALIENLNELDADIVFIKNIDNVVPDRLKDVTVKYKKLLGGILTDCQNIIFGYLKKLNSGNYEHNELIDMVKFLQRNLCCRNDDLKNLEDSELAIYLIHKFNRPIRVCGMVKNQGEPGGGPFWAYNNDGSYSLQILESSQIDKNNEENKKMFESGTYFNPVDIVCGLKDYKGEKFNLPDFIDKNTGFISSKSKNGKELRALELPGLWNGAMSDWITIFADVPVETFNPVKTVNDLLREQHQ